ncbi:LLM class flavin-dependent oxidoreductase [Neoroseomonas lacus]|uniref:Monooxygenase n=1 Tax=Neoroseomonas lacus TaxID=287609 RepID=A0A917NPW1_9PROT|nr:LLM class flavin-dependent oxidoreductase [Neoroseomonas lacus]GGJ17124.1 monooxygenase [Neoroseomonas lacus]
MMILGAIGGALGGHLGGWRHPDAWPLSMMQLSNSIEFAKTAERGKLHMMFMADGNGVRQMDKPELFAANSPSDRPSVFEPVTLYAALSQHTSRIGFVGTATTTYEEPYTLARKFGSLDHLSGGRAAWNLVTTSNAEDALNFSHSEHVARDTRYGRAREFLDVVRGLWDSWDENAFIQDKTTGRYLDPAGVQVLNHRGEHFAVKGPLNMVRPPQGHPVVFSAGQSEAGKELAAYGSDALFMSVASMQEGQSLYADIKGRMGKYGRSPDQLKLLPALSVLVGRTAAEAEALFDELQSLISPTLGVAYLSKMIGADLSGYPLDGPVPDVAVQSVGGTGIGTSIQQMALREGLTIRQAYERILPQMGGNMIKGDPEQIAAAMTEWFTSKACDGFMITLPLLPRGLNDFVDLVVPLLQQRGVFHMDYEGLTLRSNLGLQRPIRRIAAAKTLTAA